MLSETAGSLDNHWILEIKIMGFFDFEGQTRQINLSYIWKISIFKDTA